MTTPTLTMAQVAELEIFFSQARLWPCSYVEPQSLTHFPLPCGALADGARTTFPLPVMAPADVVVFADGVPVDAGDYTVHQAANLIASDANALTENTDGFSIQLCTGTAMPYSVVGNGSLYMEPAGTGRPTVSGDYTSPVIDDSRTYRG